MFNWKGSEVNDGFGDVHDLGDVNGDGVPDLIIAAPLADVGTIHAGAVYVYSGRDGTLLHLIDGSPTAIFFGSAVDDAGDVNADGHADILVGNPEAGFAGKAWVDSGADATVLHELRSTRSGAQLGHAVAGVGDVDGDGHADFLVGAPGGCSMGSW